MTHACAARGCELHVAREMLMCRRHWFMVPKRLRDRVWAAYRGHGAGASSWVEASNAAIAAVFELEHSVKLIYSCTLPTHPQRGGW
jgi:hypothetical protein